jgi:hypothetical protein
MRCSLAENFNEACVFGKGTCFQPCSVIEIIPCFKHTPHVPFFLFKNKWLTIG